MVKNDGETIDNNEENNSGSFDDTDSNYDSSSESYINNMDDNEFISAGAAEYMSISDEDLLVPTKPLK